MEIRFTKHQLVELTAPRPLSSHESAVLKVLVRGSDSALCQVDHATVTKECVDRCGTLVMRVPPAPCAQIVSGNGLLANAEWRHGDKVQDVQDVLLFVRDGYLSLLETYRGDAEVPPGLPQANDLTMLVGIDGPITWPESSNNDHV